MGSLYHNRIGKRIDIFLSSNSEYTRARVSRIISQGLVKQNNRIIEKASYKTKLGSIELIDIVEELEDIKPINLPLKIIYQDRDIAIIDKDAGVLEQVLKRH